MLLIVVGVLGALLVLGVLVHLKSTFGAPAKGRRIPGPYQWPLVGNLPLFLTKEAISFEVGVLHKCALTYGEVFRIRSLSFTPQVVFVSNPEALKRLLQTGFTEGVYGKGAFLRAQFRDLFGEGIFNSNGGVWKAHREFAKTLFTPDHLR